MSGFSWRGPYFDRAGFRNHDRHPRDGNRIWCNSGGELPPLKGGGSGWGSTCVRNRGSRPGSLPVYPNGEDRRANRVGWGSCNPHPNPPPFRGRERTARVARHVIASGIPAANDSMPQTQTGARWRQRAPVPRQAPQQRSMRPAILLPWSAPSVGRRPAAAPPPLFPYQAPIEFASRRRAIRPATWRWQVPAPSRAGSW
jgi:hypothetical protein